MPYLSTKSRYFFFFQFCGYCCVYSGDLCSPEIRALSPRGKVPILVDSGFIIYESLAILMYLEDTYPEVCTFYVIFMWFFFLKIKISIFTIFKYNVYFSFLYSLKKVELVEEHWWGWRKQTMQVLQQERYLIHLLNICSMFDYELL